MRTAVAQPDLTAKQEAFALAYIETANASEAYRRAYNVRPDTKPESIWQEACRTLANENVAKRVMELQEAARERAMVTVEGLTAELEDARLLAMSDEKGASAAVSAIMGKAKLHGLLIDKKEHSGPGGGKFEVEWVAPKTDLDRAKAVAEVLSKGGDQLMSMLPPDKAKQVAILAGLEEAGRKFMAAKEADNND